MTERRSRLRTPWLAPIAVTAAVAVGLIAQPLLASGDGSDLPELSAEELVTRVLEAEPRAMSGTVVHTARLGLPELLTEAAGADPMSLLGGSSTLRLWTDGEERARISLLGDMSEYSVVADGEQVWTYSSSDDEVARYTVSDADRARLETMSEEARAEALEKQAELPTPQEAAAEALAGVEEFSTVRVDSQVKVAGRSAYQLVVTPDTDGTLVDHVVLAVDGETMTPLRVQTWSTQDETAPAIEVSFTDVDFQAPAESVFEFSTPPGATQRDVVIPIPTEGTEPPAHEAGAPAHESDFQQPTVHGTGWESVVELTGVDVESLLTGNPVSPGAMPEGIPTPDKTPDLSKEFSPEGSMDLDVGALFDQLTTQVPEGRAFSTTLLSVLMTDDGRVLVGAVPVETLQAMA